MRFLHFLLLVSFFSSAANAQNLVSLTPIDQGELRLIQGAYVELGLLQLQPTNGYDGYRVAYTMDNIQGEQDTVTGLFLRPQQSEAEDLGKKFPLVISMHGTTKNKFDVPSEKTPITDIFATEGDRSGFDLSHIFCTQGYVTLAPDYLGMGGSNEAFHPYVHARTEAESGLQMMLALRGRPEFDNVVNELLYLTGYSQGGHASMALHELLIEEYAGEIEVTGASHMSGPYSLSDVMLNDVILKDSTFQFLGFLPYTVLSRQFTYPDLEQDVGQIFRSSYVSVIEEFRDNFGSASTDFGAFNEELKRLYVIAEADSSFYPYRLLTPKFAEELRSGTNDAWARASRENDTYDFVNPTPTRLMYCKADDQVNYRNALVASDTLNQLGATQTAAIDVAPTADHGGCVFPAVTATLEFFAEVNPLSSGLEIPGASSWRWMQSGETLRIVADDVQGASYTLSLSDVLGRTNQVRTYRSGESIDLGQLPAGAIAVRLTDELGRSTSKILVLP